MNKIKFSKWRKGLVLSATFLFALFLVVSCKKKDSLLGQNSLDSNELLNSGGIDTFSLNTFSIFEDSVITDNPAFAILGSYTDPVFGKVNSEFYTQFRLSGINPNFGTTSDIIIDSFVLGLEYTGYYGKTGAQIVEAYEINEPNVMSLDSIYYAFSTQSTKTTNLVPAANQSVNLNPSNVTVIGNDTVDSQLRIYIDTNLARSIFDEWESNPTTFTSNTEFLQFFKGLHIKTNNPVQSSGNGGVFYFNLNDALSKLTIYYRQGGQQKTYDLLINSECVDFNHVEVDRSGTHVETVINDTISGQSQFYAQSFNSRAVVQIPGLSNIPKNVIIHKATLELPIQYQTGSKFSPGYDISVGTRLTVGANQIYNIGTTGIYDDYTKKFTIDLRSYTQAIVNDELENTELILSPILFITSGDRIIFNGQQSSNKAKPKFSIIYTEF